MDYRVIKENDLFLLTDKHGNIPKDHPYGPGLYAKDTRFLSQFELKINGKEPILLTSSGGDNYMASMKLTNPHIEENGEVELWRESVELERKRFIFDGVCYEEIIAKSYAPKPIHFNVSLHLDADFIDMFLIRGFQSGNTGERQATEVSDAKLVFHYNGADGLARATHISWNEQPTTITENSVAYGVELNHGESKHLVFAVAPGWNHEEPHVKEHGEALSGLLAQYENWNRSNPIVTSDRKDVVRLFERGLADLNVLQTDIGRGPMPVAGLPWFAVPFGRDSLIASLQALPFKPHLAKATLKTMAVYQGTKVDPWRDEQPGKIMHELRQGELAKTNQVPFTPYYGTVDATPLFLILLVEYVKTTGDLALLTELEGTVEGALMWIDEYGDLDGDGFVEYHQESSKGIANQGWKDSADSIVHRTGDFAETPIALAEVQGYVYQAKKGLSELFTETGKEEKAVQLNQEAETLKGKFEQAFWMPEQQFYAVALDKEKKQVGTLTTNPGHVLMSEMLQADRALHVSDAFVTEAFFSGYGIRTMAEGEAAYNPMSYHDGSIWPHDNSMILLGMSKLGHQAQAGVVIEGLLKAAGDFEYDRLPELFCGYNDQQPVVPYPVACSPQAWAAGTSLVFIQSMLGLTTNVLKKEVIVRPALIAEMNELHVRNIPVGKGLLEVKVTRQQNDFKVEILSNTTGLEIDIMN
ncbi:glycogen debranching enzyme [Alkalihalobacillus xiaoxiensis]|uniref:Glycogen debranching enzyme n=1 Tax=Shouchella xiaoxiensis TaxID=766895 RepID=A0ABS2SWT4_9BACI|nr:amylo-alpha-1,6-glucosidase [Shouchella xiaoxiensis]MBM7839641.1 glycogen debranching enzyme [Shouchella xiaoxiensis]